MINERYLFRVLEQIRDETHENNIMLKQICKYINTKIIHYSQDNNDEFNRNIFANLISNFIDINRFKR